MWALSLELKYCCPCQVSNCWHFARIVSKLNLKLKVLEMVRYVPEILYSNF